MLRPPTPTKEAGDTVLGAAVEYGLVVAHSNGWGLETEDARRAAVVGDVGGHETGWAGAVFEVAMFHEPCG